jgi:ribosomal protein L37AE/L43A
MSHLKKHNNSKVKTIELNSNSRKIVKNIPRTGQCKGCGRKNSNLRNVTKEYLCLECRDNIKFKLITKSTALDKYKNVTYKDLINEFKAKKIHCFFVKNWYDPSKDCIKLYYEKEIQKLNNSKKVK